MLQAMRLSSVWPIDFQYHSQAPATGYSCAGYVKMAADFTVRQQFKHLMKHKSIILQFTVVGPYRVSK